MKHPVDATTPCLEAGCSQPRHVTRGGTVKARCTEHHRLYRASCPAYVKPVDALKRVMGRPLPPTVLIDEGARTVRQIKGNTILSECALPERGLHPQTLDILERRGWRVRYVHAVRETA